MTSNVLPLFWHLASSSRDARLGASADLVAAVEGFQRAYAEAKAADEDEDEDEDEDDEDDEDEDDEEESGVKDEDSESGMEVDSDDDGDAPAPDAATAAAAARLDAKLARDNAQDVVYCVKRLVRGLGSSRESSRQGFAVALTELLARTPTVTAEQVLSLIIRSSQFNKGMKGSEERDMMFARLFGLVAVIDSGALYASTARVADFEVVLDSLLALAGAKAWLAEAAGWALQRAVEALIASDVAWKDAAVDALVERLYEDKIWTPERIALTITLQTAFPERDWKALTAPTFKHAPLLTQQNLVTLGRVLKEGGDESATTGAYKPQLHYVWDIILSSYFKDGKDAAPAGFAPFQDIFRVVVDEALFANTSSAERKYWGFQVFERALPLLAPAQVPLVFTPNFMRTWMNHLSSSDRHLHKAALSAARVVQEHVKESPAGGFTLLSQLVGKHGRPDFDRVTKTKTVESIMASLTPAGVAEYVAFLEKIVVGHNADPATLEDRRVWALDQLVALTRNGAVPKDDAWVGRVLDLLLVHGFFIVRKADKKSKIAALHTVPKPPLSEATAAIARARFFSALVEVTAATPPKTDGPTRAQGTDASGKLWLTRALETVAALESSPCVEVVADADDEIKRMRTDALETIKQVRAAGKGDKDDVARGTEILLSFIVLQTYDEVEDALDMLEEAVGAARGLFESKKGKGKGKKTDKKADTTEDADGEQPPPIDALLDVIIALLDKASADLRTLANLVFGMVAPAMTASSIQHLVAQLEQSAVTEGDADEDDEEDEDEEDEDEDEDDDEDASDSDSEDEEDDGDATVDPEFRRRVAAALQVSGLGVDGADGEAAEGDEDGDDSDDESVWDDEQMMKVDEQLAAVFRQQKAGKRSDLKHAAIESLHFKNRVLDLFDTYARRQASNPLVLSTLLPLLTLVRSPGELANKAAGILRTRIAKAAHAPAPGSVSEEEAAAALGAIHEAARRAPSAEFSALCSAASLFAARAAPAPALAAYRATLADFMTRKSSQVHPAFLLDYARRHPARAWALVDDLLPLLRPSADAEGAVNAYRHTQGYALLSTLLTHLPALVRAGDVSQADAEKTLSTAATDVYATLQTDGWKADRLKEAAKAALQIARAAKQVAPERAGQVCHVGKAREVEAALKEGRTKEFKGVQGLMGQLVSVLGGKEGKKGKEVKEVKGKESSAMDVDGDADADADEQASTPKKRKAAPEKKAKGTKTKKVKAKA